MEENTVNISLKRYNELRDLETAINENEACVYSYGYFGELSLTSRKIISQDDAVKEINKQIENSKEHIESLKEYNLDLKEQLRSKEEELRDLIFDHRFEIMHIKKMSIFEFLRYRNE